jgi:hypothetical protein
MYANVLSNFIRSPVTNISFLVSAATAGGLFASLSGPGSTAIVARPTPSKFAIQCARRREPGADHCALFAVPRLG